MSNNNIMNISLDINPIVLFNLKIGTIVLISKFYFDYYILT
jgi:hypothetical protein